MQKNPEENFQFLQVDPITGEYFITIPEWMTNDLEWYEDTQIRLSIDGNDLIVSENNND
jgi:hypothetical protein